MENNRTPQFYRVASGDYETSDGRFRMYRIPGVNPPAWNVDEHDEAAGMYGTVVDGAATKRDAEAFFADYCAGPA